VCVCVYICVKEHKIEYICVKEHKIETHFVLLLKLMLEVEINEMTLVGLQLNPHI